jgi:hypothetical protein
MSEQTTSEKTAIDDPSVAAVERSPEPRLPTGPPPSFGNEGSSFEIPGSIPSAKAILRALRLR